MLLGHYSSLHSFLQHTVELHHQTKQKIKLTRLLRVNPLPSSPLPFLRDSWNVAGTTPTPSKAATRWQFIGVILMSVALGMFFATILDNWLRGESFIWWLLLAGVFIFAISTNTFAILKRIP